MREKFKYLFKNFSFLLIGNFSSKILSFILVPLYTSVLTTEEYGAYDIVYDTILLLIPVLSLNVTDAIMRFTVDTDNVNKKNVVTVANKYTFISCIVFAVGLSAFWLITKNDLVQKYFLQIILLFICTIVQQNIVQVARGFEKIKHISISGVIGTGVTLGLNIYFLLILKSGLSGYFAANIIALLVQIVVLLFSAKIYKYISLGIRKIQVEKEMLKYSIPLMATTLSWYINSVADRYMIIFIAGTAANGVYAVSYKIPAIMTAVQTIFIQSWQLSAVKEFDTEEGKAFVNKAYLMVQTVMIILCSMTILFTRILAKILFQADFYEAWICVPTLVFYVLFNTLSGTLGGIFSAVKDTKTFMNTAIIGVVVNVCLNVVLIWWIGILGAAIATALSSVVIWALRMKAAGKYMKIDFLKNKALLQFILLVLQAIFMTSITSYYGYIIQAAILLMLIVINKNELVGWVKKIKR